VPTFLARSRVDLLLLIVAIAWGSTYFTAQQLVTPDAVFTLLAVRMLAAAAIMLLVVAVRRQRISGTELRTGLILGLLLAAVFTCETFGIAHTSATNAGLIISLTMVFTPLLEALVNRRRPSAIFLLAGTIAVIGVALLASGGELRPPSLGDLLMVGAAVIRAIHVTTMQRLTAHTPVDSLRLTTVQLATCAVIFTVTSLFTGTPLPRYLQSLGGSRLLLLAYLVVACTVFAFFIQTWAVRRTSASRVSLLLGTEPVWAAVIGLVIAHDRVGVAGYIGIALILVGTAVGRSTVRRPVPRPHRSRPATF
jgi:drug/metabolite transporter (DMT)-like permease